MATTCDVCNANCLQEESIFRAEEFRMLVLAGFRPPNELLELMSFGRKSLGEVAAEWQSIALASVTDWVLCPVCNDRASKCQSDHEERVLDSGGGFIKCVAISADGRRAISGKVHGLRLWDLENGMELGHLGFPSVFGNPRT
jgi:hypothetical protein